MKLVILFVVFVTCEGLDNYLNSPLYPCVQCLCHARSGCWRRQNCAKYSIDKTYWEDAGSLVVDDDDPKDGAGFNKCMADENCIVGTIIRYTEKFGRIDCNCDGKFDCKDRAAIHMFKSKGRCENPKFGHTFARRFNECAKNIGVKDMLSTEGDSFCTEVEVQ